MSSAGHGADGVNRFVNNQRMKSQRKARTAKIREAYIDAMHVYGGMKVYDKKVSAKEMKAIKEKIRNKIKREQKSRFVKALIATFLALTGVAFILYLLSLLGMF